MPLSIFPKHVIEQYDLRNKAKHGKVYLDIRRLVYGLLQPGQLVNNHLKVKLAPTGYYEVPHITGLWKHILRPVSFTLVVDDSEVKYVGKKNIQHLINALKKDFTLSEDYMSGLYCGIILEWDYENRTLDFPMPG